MADWRNYYKKGLNQTEYRRDKARLDKFNVLESDWKELFRWIMSTAWEKKFYNPAQKSTDKLIRVWQNHVLTVLIEIVQKDTDEYKDTFVKSRGTVDQKLYTRNLCEKITDWSNRLDNFLRTRSLQGSVVHRDSSIRAAESVRQHLTDALQGKAGDKFQAARSLNPANQPFYQMLQSIRNIQSQSEGYIRMIEDSGTLDSSLALLLVYIRNYCLIADKFNKSLLSLPDYYHHEILHTTAYPVVQDRTYLVVNPKNEGFTLYEGTRFLAGSVGGQPLFYSTLSPRYLTAGKLMKACTVFRLPSDAPKSKFRTQQVDLNDPAVCTLLFDPSKARSAISGWLVESHMLVLREGRRKVTLAFRLTSESTTTLAQNRPTEADLKAAFSLRTSYAEGWMDYLPVVSLAEVNGQTSLTFCFTILETEFPLSPCLTDIHGSATTYPCLQILTCDDNCPYDWAKVIAFDRIGIDVDVEGIRQFSLYNELGEIDSAQPFYPFGTQAEQGNWFMFSHNEISRKTISELSFRGTWNKLPQTAAGYADIYKNFAQEPPITNQSFQIKAEYQKNDRWYPCPEVQLPLFAQCEEPKPAPPADPTVDPQPEPQSTPKGMLKEQALIYFRMTDPDGHPLAMRSYMSNATTTNRAANLLFRVTLTAPAIGFGMEAYRRLFADIMIYNSSRKEKEQKEIPTLPVVPLLTDIELTYKASWNSDDPLTSARLVRITDFQEFEECIPHISHAFLEDMVNPHNLYLKFTGLGIDKKLCLYVDLSYNRKDMFLSDGSFNTESPFLEFDYRYLGKWMPLKPECLFLEATCGFTQNGFIELFLPEEVQGASYTWLRIRLQGYSGQYPAIRSIYLNCLQVIAENGDGTSLPSETIQKMQIEDPRVGSIFQPLPGFGGKVSEDVSEVSIRQSARIAHRNRAVTPKDYERMVLNQFPYILKVHCLSHMCTGIQNVYVVVFSYTDGNPYPMTPAYKLTEIYNWLSGHISPFVSLKVCNPSYQKVEVACQALLQKHSEDEGEVRRRMMHQVMEYFAAWIEAKDLPELGRRYSYKELHTRLANDPDVFRLVGLTINGIQPEVQATDINARDQFIPDEHTPIGTVLIPSGIKIELLPYKDDPTSVIAD